MQDVIYDIKQDKNVNLIRNIVLCVKFMKKEEYRPTGDELCK